MPNGYLTTHVLDTARGRPAAGLQIVLTYAGTELARMSTNADGRTDGPILPQEAFQTGAYTLNFHAGDYLRGVGTPSDFLDVVPINFLMTDDVHYHVPLLLSPYGYSTYRGS